MTKQKTAFEAFFLLFLSFFFFSLGAPENTLNCWRVFDKNCVGFVVDEVSENVCSDQTAGHALLKCPAVRNVSVQNVHHYISSIRLGKFRDRFLERIA